MDENFALWIIFLKYPWIARNSKKTQSGQNNLAAGGDDDNDNSNCNNRIDVLPEDLQKFRKKKSKINIFFLKTQHSFFQNLSVPRECYLAFNTNNNNNKNEPPAQEFPSGNYVKAWISTIPENPQVPVNERRAEKITNNVRQTATNNVSQYDNRYPNHDPQLVKRNVSQQNNQNNIGTPAQGAQPQQIDGVLRK